MPARFFVFLVDMGILHVGLAHLELLTSGNPLAFVSQSAGITGISHCAQARKLIFKGTSEKLVLSLQLTFSKVDHAILSPLGCLVFYRETDFLSNQLLSKELSSWKCPRLKDKTNMLHENGLVPDANQHSSNFIPSINV